MRPTRFIVGLLLVSLSQASIPLAASAGTTEPKLSKKLLAMTPEAFRSTATVKDDALEFETIISTEPSFSSGRKNEYRARDDSYVQAILNKENGEIRYEVRQFIRYLGPRRDYKRVHYIASDGLRHADLSIARHGADTCAYTDLNAECVFTKDLAFDLPEAELRAIAATYRPDTVNAWSFRFKDVSGADYSSSIVPAEVVGLLQAVDDYRKRSGKAVLPASASLPPLPIS